MNAQYVETVFRDRTLWAACPVSLNDPFEGDMDIDPDLDVPSFIEYMELEASEALREGDEEGALFSLQASWNVLHDPHVFRDRVVRYAEEAAREGRGRGIVSLCADPLNKLMWTHYADNHRGFCVEYRRGGCQILAGEWCQPVLYRDRYPTLRASDVLSVRPKQAFFDLLRTKSTDWEYEHEWRVVWPEGDKAVGPLQVTGVIFGLRTPDHTSKAVRGWADKIEGIRFGHVRQIGKTFHMKVEWE